MSEDGDPVEYPKDRPITRVAWLTWLADSKDPETGWPPRNVWMSMSRLMDFLDTPIKVISADEGRTTRIAGPQDAKPGDPRIRLVGVERVVSLEVVDGFGVRSVDFIGKAGEA